MNKSERNEKLLFSHQYAKAENAFTKNYLLNEPGGIQDGDILNYAIALIGNNKYDKAIDHISNIILPKRVPSFAEHEILLGIAFWYKHEYKKAIDFWKLALKSFYASDKGFTDVYSMLFFAAIHRPKSVEFDELVNSLSKYQKHLDSRDFPDKVYRYYQGKIDSAALIGYSTLCNIGFNSKDIQYDAGELKDRGKAYFHIAMNCLRNKDPKGYYNNLRLCVNTKYDQYQVEFLVAYLEVQRLKREKT
jgi:tetratricopeptide (TPR) repeat protein